VRGEVPVEEVEASVET
jgi:hypothetical protein